MMVGDPSQDWGGQPSKRKGKAQGDSRCQPHPVRKVTLSKDYHGAKWRREDKTNRNKEYCCRCCVLSKGQKRKQGREQDHSGDGDKTVTKTVSTLAAQEISYYCGAEEDPQGSAACSLGLMQHVDPIQRKKGIKAVKDDGAKKQSRRETDEGGPGIASGTFYRRTFAVALFYVACREIG